MDCEILNKWNMESIVYLGYFNPKTQRELAKLVYDKPIKQININPLVNARIKLMELNFIEACPKQFKAKNIKYQSKPDPFIELAKLELEKHISESMKTEHIFFTSKNINALKLILNSNWFRYSFTSNEAIKSRLDYCNTVYRSPRFNTLEANAYQFLAAQLNDISTITIAFYYPLKFLEIPIVRTNDIKEDFDTFLTTWPQTHNLENNQDLNTLTNQLFNRLLKIFRSPWNRTFFEPIFKNYAFACFPIDLALKTWRIGRSSRTLWGLTTHEIIRFMKKIDKNYTSPIESYL